MKNCSDKIIFQLCKFLLIFSVFIVCAAEVFMQTSKPLEITNESGNEIIIKINEVSKNTQQNPPLVKLYEVTKVGDNLRTSLRSSQITLTRTNDDLYLIKIIAPQPSYGFVKFEVDISNYISGNDILNFRSSVSPEVKVVFIEGNQKILRLKFTVPNIKKNCSEPVKWIKEAFKPETNTTLKITQSSNETELFEFKKVKVYDTFGNNLDTCNITTDLTLDRKLPVAETLNPSVIKFTESFINSKTTLVDYPPFASLRDGITLSIKTNSGLNEAEKRDEKREVVLEAGGGLTTAKQKENVTDTENDRETSGFLDLRIALPTKNYFKEELPNNGSGPKILTNWQTWTPLQFEAMISEGKLEKKNLSTNTMRLFTQYQFVKDTFKDNKDFVILNLEGGAAADRDLRVIDYTGNIDFRWEPGFLNRTFGNSEAGKTPTLNFEWMPASIELGGRQERRDPFFSDTDTFIRRFRFSEKLDLQLPPYAQLTIEHRAWLRGEVSENKFRNYFKTTLNIFPRNLDDNFSAGVFLSYERGTLPPFSTPSISTFKVGFRVRRKQW